MKKRILITGATSGIGLKTAESLAEKGHELILACRNLELAESIRDRLISSYNNPKIDLVYLDLSSFKNIKKFIDDFNQEYAYLDVLINNAGAFFDKKHLSEDGYEKTMAVNFLGQVLLTEGLLPPLKTVEHARIINICSKAAFSGKLNLTETMFVDQAPNFKAYSASKLAQLMYTIELSDRLKDNHITVNAVHPGSVATGIWKGESLLMKLVSPMMMKKADLPEVAAQTPVYLATSPDVRYKTGEMYEKVDHVMTLPHHKLESKTIENLMALTYEILNIMI